MTNPILILLAVAFIYFAGYLAGENKATAFYNEQMVTAEQIYKKALASAEQKASDLSQEYLELSHELSSVNSTNDDLVKRLQQLENRAATNKNTRCSISCPACPEISSRMAKHINGITERADKAALYATQCHKWILSLKQTQNQ